MGVLSMLIVDPLLKVPRSIGIPVGGEFFLLSLSVTLAVDPT